MVVSDIQPYEILNSKFGAVEAEAVVQTIERRVEEKRETIASTKDISDLKLYVKDEVSTLRAEMLRTIYLVGFGQLIGIVGAVIALVQLLGK